MPREDDIRGKFIFLDKDEKKIILLSFNYQLVRMGESGWAGG